MVAKTSGTQFLLEEEILAGGGSFRAIAYLQTNSANRTNATVDVSNKTDGNERCLRQIGQKTLDVSGTLFASDDDTYLNLRARQESSTIWTYRISDENGYTRTASFFVESINETGEVNGAHTSAIELKHSGAVATTP